ncbi:hypothetical protein CP02DC14_2331, partial [Chlamydia psittaci 02DC14]
IGCLARLRILILGTCVRSRYGFIKFVVRSFFKKHEII